MDEKETGRIEAFSDGVFAVAITLLVLNIKLPDDTVLSALRAGADPNGVVWDFIGKQWLFFLAFLVSFATIGIMWINHHRLFTHIKRTNNTLLMLNLLLLLVIVFIPYPTELLANAPIRPGFYAPALIYDANFFLMALIYNVLWRYASHKNRLLARDTDKKAVKAISDQYIFGPVLYLVVLLLAFVNVPISLTVNALLAIFFALPGRQLKEDGEHLAGDTNAGDTRSGEARMGE